MGSNRKLNNQLRNANSNIIRAASQAEQAALAHQAQINRFVNDCAKQLYTQLLAQSIKLPVVHNLADSIKEEVERSHKDKARICAKVALEYAPYLAEAMGLVQIKDDNTNEQVSD